MGWSKKVKSGKDDLRDGAHALRDLRGIHSSNWLEGFTKSDTGFGGSLLHRTVSVLRPQGPGTCDHTFLERAANLLTTLPFFVIGLHTIRQRQTGPGRTYGASLMGVGVGAIAFHSTWGRLRPVGRKIDYWCIALSSTSLLRAIMPETTPAHVWAGLAVIPFQPFAVTATNAVAMEVEYFRRARGNQALRRPHRQHVMAAALGMACFALEDVCPKLPFIHTLWHGLSAYSVHKINFLLADVEGPRPPTLPDGPLP